MGLFLLNHIALLKILHQTPAKKNKKGTKFKTAVSGAAHHAGSEGEVLEAMPTSDLDIQHFPDASI